MISFLDVFDRSACRPLETMVDIFQEYPDEVEYIFKPSCVPLKRCAGCCNDEALECVPTAVRNITMEVRLWLSNRVGMGTCMLLIEMVDCISQPLVAIGLG